MFQDNYDIEFILSCESICMSFHICFIHLLVCVCIYVCVLETVKGKNCMQIALLTASVKCERIFSDVGNIITEKKIKNEA